MLRRSLVSWILSCGLAAGTQAATYRPTSLADGEDAVRGDGLCATEHGACTLRAALQEANQDWGSTVELGPGTYTLELGGLWIAWGTALRGAGPDVTVLDGLGTAALLHTWGGEITGLAMQGFTVGMKVEDGLVSHCRVSGGSLGLDFSTYSRPSPIEAVELVENDRGLECGDCTLRDSIVSRNRGDGIVAGSVTLEGTRVTDNEGLGVHVHAVDGNATLIDSTISGNGGFQHGLPGEPTAGGIMVRDGQATLTRTQVRDNAMAPDVFALGGYDVEQSSVGTMESGYGWGRPSGAAVRNSTIGYLDAQTLTAEHATLGLFACDSASLSASVLRGCGTAWVDGLRGDGNFSPPGCGITGTGNLQGDPLLGPLSDEGTGRRGRPPLAGSPLIDAADPRPSRVVDQLGRPRPIDFDGDGDARPDIGAIEACSDSDGDGACDLIDCAPEDPAVQRPPAEPTLVLQAPRSGEVLLTWTDSGVAVDYDVARGSLEELWRSERVSGNCVGDTVATEHVDLPFENAFYLVRARRTCTGGWGRDSAGGERSACP